MGARGTRRKDLDAQRLHESTSTLMEILSFFPWDQILGNTLTIVPFVSHNRISLIAGLSFPSSSSKNKKSSLAVSLRRASSRTSSRLARDHWSAPKLGGGGLGRR